MWPMTQSRMALYDGSFKCRGQCRQLYGRDAFSQIANDRGDVVESSSGVWIAHKVEQRQLDGGHFHAAGICFSVFDTSADRRHVLAIMEGDGGPSGTNSRQPLVGDDLKFHHSLMGSAVQFGGFEQAHMVGTTLMSHEIVDIPLRRRRAPSKVLGRNDDVEPAPRTDQMLLVLLAFCYIQECARVHTKCFLGLLREKTTRPVERRLVK